MFFASVAGTGKPPEGESPDFSAGDDFVAVFNMGAAKAVEAFSAEGAMDRIMHMPFGDLPGSAFINIAAVDTFTHGWDLARATGQPTNLDPALASDLLGLASLSSPTRCADPSRRRSVRRWSRRRGRRRPTSWLRTWGVSPRS